MKVRNWVFTSFDVKEPFYHEKIQYLVYQREVCPSTQKEHWQGYAEFKSAISLSSAQTALGIDKGHLEVRKGSQKQAVLYCIKNESRKPGAVPVTQGAAKLQGARNDLDSMIEAIHDGATKVELLREFRGNAFRHLGMIDRAQRCLYGFDEMDNYILKARKVQEGWEGL